MALGTITSPAEQASTVLPPDVKLRGVSLIIRLYLLSKLRMSAAVPLFSPYAFVAWTVTPIPLLHL
jgi:hypothetical protein